MDPETQLSLIIMTALTILVMAFMAHYLNNF